MLNTKITINNNQDTAVEIQQWPLICSEPSRREPDRVSIQFEGISYSIILDKVDPRIESWNLDDKGELKNIISHSSLPKK